ncbi:MAG: type IX secretion system sortase PorU [Bacteroidota bacterium]|nr:type IX secretion system sortase PorU [Bacteroidota bacterium]
MVIRIALSLLLLGSFSSFGQTKSNYLGEKEAESEFRINWQGPFTTRYSDTETIRLLGFPEANYSFEDGFLPRMYQKVQIQGNETSFEAFLINTKYEQLSDSEASLIRVPSLVKEQPVVTASIAIHKKSPSGSISFIPLRKNPSTGKIEKLISYDVSVVSGDIQKSRGRAVHTYAPNSVLQSGNWYKIALAKDGIYQLSYSFLRSLGLDLTSVDPKNIRVYGNGGGMLPNLNAAARPDDLVESAVVVNGEADGVFHTTDYVLFYGEGPHRWNYNSSSLCNQFEHKTHLFSDSTYYFITADLGPGKRILPEVSSALPVTHNVTGYDDRAFHESDNVNFIKSGSQWFGEYFENNPSYNFSFIFPNFDGSAPATVKTNIASRYEDLSGTADASYSISCQSGGATLLIPEISGGSYGDYAKINNACFSFTPTSPTLTVNVTKNTADALAWLDYIELNVRCQLNMTGTQMHFRDLQSVGAGNVARFNITSSQPLTVWDVTDQNNISSQVLSNSGSLYQFIQPSDSLKEYVAFTAGSYLIPYKSIAVENQDLHALMDKDYLIVVHPEFYDEAVQLANHHQNADGMSTAVVTTFQIYNEFSSGAQDITAIRDFVKMFYDRATIASEMPEHLLLFGDGSYDNKKRFTNNSNYIPTYQSDNSTILITSYVSDDYYGMLDDIEGLFAAPSSSDMVDIGIGRFPVRSKSEAQTAISKVFAYTKTGVPPTFDNTSCTDNQSISPYGDWRNTICFIGDDEDNNLHQSDANKLATMIDTAHKDYNVDKIFLDSYLQESTPGGQRYPAASDAIDKRIEKGCLVMNYTGHGGEVGLAHERIVEVAQINKWSNADRLPLFFTATCEFSRFDDPDRTSAGEYVFLNPAGGGIALFTTVRLVFASPNFALNQDFYEAAFTPLPSGKMPRLGDLYQYIKTQVGGNSVNSRNFTLLGDPALMLAYPKHDVLTDSINSSQVSASSTDTLKALSLVTITGHIESGGVLLNTYNGVLTPTVYDKKQSITTRSNDGVLISPPFTFKVQKNVLYKGKVSVTNGVFKFSFIVPKDIAYAYDLGKISYYAENGTEDANGFYDKIIIGGSNDSAAIDNTGPEVSLYMNDAKFVPGGLTDENPDLFAVLKDANGVNTVGNGIGHDITAVLDADTDDAIILNDYYQADLNSYKSGTIRYPFSSLSEGSHSLNLKVWDVYNNSSQVRTEFVVSASAELALKHVLNYPNPFTTKTQFFFEHNQCCQLLDVNVQIFTVSGKLVKNISKYVQAEGYRSDPLEWDGRDDFGDKIGKGVYVYRVKIKTSEGAMAEKYEKLVILN